jgi:hypothetical protein
MNPMNAMEKIKSFFVKDFPLVVLAIPLTALIYEEGFDANEIFNAIAAGAKSARLRLGGVIERPIAQTASGRRCDMVLTDLASGATVKISEDRGALARGCRLDLDALARTCILVLSSLPQCNLLLLNKFGKA